MLRAMTWEELKDLLVELSEETRVASTHGLDTVALNLPPEEWFISMRMTNAPNIGHYEGEEMRLVGTEQIPLPELTAAFVRERVEQALGRQVRGMLDPEAVALFVREMKKQADLHRDRDLG